MTMCRKCSVSLGLMAAGLAPTTTSGSAQAAGDQGGVPWWVWVLIAVVVLALLLWWWLRSRRGGEAVQTHDVSTLAATPAAAPEAAPAAAETAPLAEPAPVAPDDLKLIEGIGPKIASILQAAGVTTFAQLAATDVSRLKQILADADFTAPANPGTWPEQAALAAAGKWDEFEALQDELKGGRRV
jgi:predicted flap endonuclease-1-like 5' DNA nuclease